MEAQKLSQLLDQSESEMLDFKLQHYDFSGGSAEERLRKRAEFAKDIISMANTPRNEPAYIIIGCKRSLNGTMERKGVILHVDDNELQQQLEGLVHPHPRFHYMQMELDGLQFGVIEVLPDRQMGPFLPKKDIVGTLRRMQVYLRRGSQNFEASPEESKAVYAWFAGAQPALPQQMEGEAGWSTFTREVDITELGQQYILVLAPGNLDFPETFRHLAWVDWNLVLDFNPNSETNGVLKHCRELLEARRTIHRITRGDVISSNLSRSTCWYFCRGLTGRSASLSTGQYRQWNIDYGEDLHRKFLKFASTSEPVVLVCLWSIPEMTPFVRKIMDAAASLFVNRLKSVIISENESMCQEVATEYGATVCQIATRHFLEGLSALQSTKQAGPEHVIRLPGKDGVPKEVQAHDLAWFEEDFEMVHLAAGLRLPDGQDPERDFLRGGPISWFGLGFGADVEREKLSQILSVVRKDLESRKITRINLWHKPGAGGSSLARRIVWNLRKEFPCIVLRRCIARETIERIGRLYMLCERPILLLREGSVISDNQADDLSELLGARKIPSVMLQVVRRYSDEKETDRRFFLSDKLLSAEAERLCAKLTAAVPAKSKELQALTSLDKPERTPFIYGLTAFANDFIGLRPFVTNHLQAVPPPQKKILLYLALAHAYGQQVISEQHFADIIGHTAFSKSQS